MLRLISGVAIAGLVCLAGCSRDRIVTSSAPSERAIPSQPIAVQMMNVAPELRGYRFNNLLNFEGASDRVFLSAFGAAPSPSITTDRPHTGRSSLRFQRGQATTVRLSTLLGDHPFPGDWTLVGAYFFSQQPARVQMACSVAGQPVGQNAVLIPANQWTAVMVDLTSAGNSTSAADAALTIQVDGRADVWCDDVVTVDNTYLIVGDPSGNDSQGAWSVKRRGLSIICESVGMFRTKVDSADGNPDGWTVEESSPMRVRFSSTGRNKFMTIYSDGRSYRDGKFVALSAPAKAEPLLAQQENSPAQIEVPETMGRIDRRTVGDENNDGYNESRGSYTLVSNGPRLSVTITPRSVPVMRPVLEIKGFPPGDVLVTVEGQLVQSTARLEDGTLLVDVPTKIDRTTTVTLRVQ